MHSTKRNAAAEARGVPETDQLRGKVIWENSLTPRPVQGRSGGRQPRAKGDHIERAVACSYPVLKLAAAQFDYGAISPPPVPNLQAQAKLIRNMIAKTTEGPIEVHRSLVAVKRHRRGARLVRGEEPQGRQRVRAASSDRSANTAHIPPKSFRPLALLPWRTWARVYSNKWSLKVVA
jgi:hypothetical protein